MNTLFRRAAWGLTMTALMLAQLAIAADGRRTDELMRASGMHARLAEVQPEILKAIAERADMRVEDRDRLAEILGAAFKPAKLQESATRELRRVLSAQDEDEALRFLGTDLGHRITRLQALAAADGGADRHPALAKSQWSTAPQHRRDLLGRLSAAVSYPEAAVDGYINMTTSIEYAAGLASKPTEAEKTVQAYLLTRVRNRLARLRPELVRVAGEASRFSLAYTYRDLSDEELDRVVAFAESPAGLRFSDASMKAMGHAFTVAQAETGTAIGEEWVRRRGRS